MRKELEIAQVNELKFYLNWDYVKDICNEAVIEENKKLEKKNKEYYSALMQISYLTPALGGDKEDMEKSLLEIDDICDWALRPEEMEEMYVELDK